MKKALTLFVFAVLFSANAFATYVVVMKDGTRYNAKTKWTVKNGKAIILLENGQSLQVDPAFIDVPKSEELTKLGITTAGFVDLNTKMPSAQQPKQQPTSTSSLGSTIKLRTPAQQKAAAAQQQAAPPPPPIASGSGAVSPAVIDKFERAYDNMSIFERTGEFGTLMALGNTGQMIFRLGIMENLLLGVIGSGCGVLVGMLLAWGISAVGIPMPPPPNSNAGYTASIRIVPWVVLSSFLVGLVGTLAAAIIPARKAAQLPVVEALRRNV